MFLFRMVPAEYLNNLSGRGGSYADGARWNSAGHPVIYFGLTAGVAMLEMANYISSPRLLPPTYRLGKYQVEDVDFDEWSMASLPGDWRQFPYPQSTQALGTRWLVANQKAGLILPSCTTPMGEDKIAVVNPLHPDTAKIKLIEEVEHVYNPRMFAGV